jgi:Putative DNA-binding domain
MNLKELKEKTEAIINDIKDNGNFPKENNIIDYKIKLNIIPEKDCTENFLINFAKDIISFSNGDGGIILIGIEENKLLGTYEDKGLSGDDVGLLNQIDLNLVTQKFEKIAKVGISIDLQQFQISTRKFFYLLIQKQTNVLVPSADYNEYKIRKGDIYYRTSSKNEQANSSTSDFNRFLQIKANEKSKEFMEIWSKLLPEMVDINPREVLIINPLNNKIYGFNGKENVLSSSDIEIDKSENGVFNVILNAISAGEIGRITDNEGKPLYKLVGEIKSSRSHISLSTLYTETRKVSNYKFTNAQLKSIIYHLTWTKIEQFQVADPPEGTLNSHFHEYIWIETMDKLKNTKKVVFSSNSVEKIVEVVNNESLHIQIFKKILDPNGSIGHISA